MTSPEEKATTTRRSLKSMAYQAALIATVSAISSVVTCAVNRSQRPTVTAQQAPQTAPSPPSAPTLENDKIYTEGQKFSGLGLEFSLEDWTLIMDRTGLYEFFRANPGKDLGVKIIGPDGTKIDDFFCLKHRAGYCNPGIHLGTDEENLKSRWHIGHGSEADQNTVQIVLQLTGSKVEQQKTFMVHIDNKVKPEDFTNAKRVRSQVSLPDSAVSTIANLTQLFDDFKGEPPTIIIEKLYKYPMDVRGDYNPARNVILLGDKDFKNPQLWNHMPLILFHELAHWIFEQENYATLPLASNAQKIYAQFFRHAGYRAVPQLMEDKIKTSNLFALFTEKNYKSKKHTQAENKGGHPFENVNELFASTLTVLYYFGDEFVERYQQLSAPEQQTAAQHLRNFYAIIKAGRKDASKQSEIQQRVEEVLTALKLN